MIRMRDGAVVESFIHLNLIIVDRNQFKSNFAVIELGGIQIHAAIFSSGHDDVWLKALLFSLDASITKIPFFSKNLVL